MLEDFHQDLWQMPFGRASFEPSSRMGDSPGAMPNARGGREMTAELRGMEEKNTRQRSPRCAGVRLDRRRNIRIDYCFAPPTLGRGHTPAGQLL